MKCKQCKKEMKEHGFIGHNRRYSCKDCGLVFHDRKNDNGNSGWEK